MPVTGKLSNFIGGEWRHATAGDYLPVLNPATAQTLAEVPVSSQSDVATAVEAAKKAFPDWRRLPPAERAQYLYKFKQGMESRLTDIARTLTMENGKTLAEARGEITRGIENIEVACGVPILMQGYNLENAARGIDETMIRQPLGVVAAIVPFNFPAMIPLWFLPYAIACGNTLILKPSERVPLTMQLIFEILNETGLPAGVANLVNGTDGAVNALLDHPDVRAISFVGSTPVAKLIYTRASANGKRVQCQGGAKNYVVVMPDADPEMVARAVGESAFGCAGQRCLAASVAVPVGSAQKTFKDAIVEYARSLKVGYGLDDGTQMGPVITRGSKQRIEDLIGQGVRDGASVLIDGRGSKVNGFETGNFLKPTVLDHTPAESDILKTEIFGPVLSLVPADSLDSAIRIMNKSAYGNAASLFTTNGGSARTFRHDVLSGNIGINIGVAAPLAPFPFSGWGDSFFGVLHGQGRDAIEFYTDKKVVIERWP